MKTETTHLKDSIKRKIRLSKKYLEKWEKHLTECLEWQKIYHLGELLQANLYQISKNAKEVIVSDWEKEGNQVLIPLHPPLMPHLEVGSYFKKAKKLKKGVLFAEKEVQKGNEALLKWTTLLAELESDTLDKEALLKELPPQKVKEKEEKLPPKPYLEFVSSHNIPIWVGKNAAMNDVLTFQYARGNDLWLHIADYPGSHVIIHVQKGQEIDEKTLELAMQLALYFSKARQRQEGDVVMTQVKNVSRKGKEKGRVMIHHEKRFFTRLILSSSDIQSSSSLNR